MTPFEGLLVLGVYFAPWLVALFRLHNNKRAIFTLNVLLGWTVIGWLAAMIWANTNNVEGKRRRGNDRDDDPMLVDNLTR